MHLVTAKTNVRFVQGGGLGDVILQLGAACFIAVHRHPCRIVSNTYCHRSVRELLGGTSGVEAAHSGEYYVPVHPDWPKLVDLNDDSALLKYINGHPLDWYKAWNVPFGARWDYCPIGEVVRYIAPADEEVVFIHDDATRGQAINLEGYRPKMTDSILEHIPILKSAKEIHCMDSCFYHLVESMDRPKAKLFFHAYVREPVTYWPELPMRHDWEIIRTGL